MPPKFARALGKDYHNNRRWLLEEDDLDIENDADGNITRHDTTRPEKTSVRKEVDEAVDVMRKNIGKVLDRGGKLDDLEDKSDELMRGAYAFQRDSRKLTRQLWWKRTKARIIFGLIALGIIVVIIRKLICNIIVYASRFMIDKCDVIIISD
eukprot:gene2643-5545_t